MAPLPSSVLCVEMAPFTSLPVPELLKSQKKQLNYSFPCADFPAIVLHPDNLAAQLLYASTALA